MTEYKVKCLVAPDELNKESTLKSGDIYWAKPSISSEYLIQVKQLISGGRWQTFLKSRFEVFNGKDNDNDNQ